MVAVAADVLVLGRPRVPRRPKRMTAEPEPAIGHYVASAEHFTYSQSKKDQ